MNCPHCDGCLILLGTLGDLAHFRCRDCGADCSVPADEVEENFDRTT